MTFSNDWAVASNPADHTKFKDIPAAVRKIRTDLEERFANLVYGFTSGETSEGFKKLLLNNQASDASAPTDAFVLYAKDVADASELHFRHESAGVIAITSLGKILLSALVAASQALGDIWYASSATVMSRLAGNTTTTKKFLTQTGDGAASAAPAWNALAAGDITAAIMPAGYVVQVVTAQTGAVATTSTAIPDDDSIPQSSEGAQAMTAAITPTDANNKLVIAHVGNYSAGTSSYIVAALFQDAIAAALAASYAFCESNGANVLSVKHVMTAGSTSELTFKVRFGSDAGVVTFNGRASGRKMGGVMSSTLVIMEIKV